MGSNEQRREAAKRKLERQIEHRAQRQRRNRIIAAVSVVGIIAVVIGLIIFFDLRAGWQEADRKAAAAKAKAEAAEQQKKQLAQAQKALNEQAKKVQIPSKRAAVPERKKPLPDPSSCKYAKSQEPPAKEVKAPKDGKVPASGTVDVTMDSTAGKIGLTMDRALAPCTVNSMLSLIEQGYYDDTECHRLSVEGMQMLQCGDPQGTGQGGPGYTVPDEFFKEIKYGRGLLAMANTGQPNSGGGQFFMVFGEAKLPPQYTVFGTISDGGLKVLDKVARAGIDAETAMQSQDGTGKPNMQVKFSKITVSGT